MITISGTVIPTPSGFSVEVLDVVGDTQVNVNGDLIAERKATKRKLSLEWKYLTNAQISSLLGIFAASFFVTVLYPDPLTGAMRSGTFYPGNRANPMLDYRSSTARWKDVKFNLIER